MFKKKNESGRSMVEMLGVLAIIGVLSIGGIAGYTLSMRKHRANILLDVVNKYALIAYGACQKAVMNQDITDINSCNTTTRNKLVPAFEDSGLGNVPGTDWIVFTHVKRESETDIVHIVPGFNDMTLCKTVKGIVGDKNNYTCTGGSSITIPIKFN